MSDEQAANSPHVPFDVDAELVAAWKARAEAAEGQCAVLRQALKKVLEGQCWCAPHPETRMLGHDVVHCEGFLALNERQP